MAAKRARTNSSSISSRNLLWAILGVGILILGIVSLQYFNSLNNPTQSQSNATTGNGAPNGSHYNLNIIGVSNTKNFDPGSTGESGHVIFVPQTGKTNILLTEGADFQVLNSDGVNGSAQFQLPNPDPTNSGTTVYSVWARALGKPGGYSTTNTCATDPTTGDTYCSIYQLVSMRNKGNSQFTDVSKQLLYIYYYNSTGQLVRVPLFDSTLQNYFWSYDNHGLKLLQLRFYPVSSTVPSVPPTTTP